LNDAGHVKYDQQQLAAQVSGVGHRHPNDFYEVVTRI